jgi:hypothetical protein
MPATAEKFHEQNMDKSGDSSKIRDARNIMDATITVESPVTPGTAQTI